MHGQLVIVELAALPTAAGDSRIAGGRAVAHGWSSSGGQWSGQPGQSPQRAQTSQTPPFHTAGYRRSRFDRTIPSGDRIVARLTRSQSAVALGVLAAGAAAQQVVQCLARALLGLLDGFALPQVGQGALRLLAGVAGAQVVECRL